MTPLEFEIVYFKYYRRLYLYATDFIPDDENICRDITGDVFSTLWSIKESVNAETVEPYLRTSIRNACLNHLRLRHNKKRYEEFIRLSKEEMESLDSIDDRVETLKRAISGLPDRTRQILELCYLHGHTYKEVAEMTGISADGVKSHIVKAYAYIRKYFLNHP